MYGKWRDERKRDTGTEKREINRKEKYGWEIESNEKRRDERKHEELNRIERNGWKR